MGILAFGDRSSAETLFNILESSSLYFTAYTLFPTAALGAGKRTASGFLSLSPLGDDALGLGDVLNVQLSFDFGTPQTINRAIFKTRIVRHPCRI